MLVLGAEDGDASLGHLGANLLHLSKFHSPCFKGKVVQLLVSKGCFKL